MMSMMDEQESRNSGDAKLKSGLRTKVEFEVPPDRYEQVRLHVTVSGRTRRSQVISRMCECACACEVEGDDSGM